MKVRLEDGREVRRRVDEAWGSGGNPLTMEEIRKKYRECAGGLQGEEKMEKTIPAVENLEELQDIRGFIEHLREF